MLKNGHNDRQKAHTTPTALEQFKYLYTLNPYFISMELVFLYRENYFICIAADCIKSHNFRYPK